MKKLVLAMCFVLLCSVSALAIVNVNFNDLKTFKESFADDTIQDMNISGVSDAVVYKFVITAINSAWETYSSYPFYLYSEADGEVSYITIPSEGELFDHQTVQLIEVQSKARFFRAIYSSMKDLNLEQTTEPEWMMLGLQDETNEVIYLLEVNPAALNYKRIEEHVVDLLGKTKYIESKFFDSLDNAVFTLIIATYVDEFNEIVVDMLFTDADGNVLAEAVMTRNNIF